MNKIDEKRDERTPTGEHDQTLVSSIVTPKVSPERVASIVENFTLEDSLSVLNFGNEAISKITSFSDKVLAEIRGQELGEAGELLSAMISHMSETNVAEVKANRFLSSLPIIGGMFDQFSNFVKRFDTVKDNLDALVNQLRSNEAKLGSDLKQLDALYHENISMLGELEVYIEAGKKILAKMRDVDLVTLEARAKETQDPLDSQNLHDAKQTMLRLEKRVNNLEIARLSAIQTAPQIRLSQEGNRMLIEDIQDIIHNTIPLWKRQFLIAISNYEKEKSLKVTKAVKDYTNQQYVRNAEKLQALEEQISQNYQRGILDVSSLEQVNKITIDTLNNTLKNYEEGRRMRQDAEKAIARMEGELKTTLVKALEENH